jgi:hypothetical protein
MRSFSGIYLYSTFPALSTPDSVVQIPPAGVVLEIRFPKPATQASNGKHET